MVRYIIGYEAIDKLKAKFPNLTFEHSLECKGIYSVDWLPIIINEHTQDYIVNRAKVPVFDNLENAQEKISALSRDYRRDDVSLRPNKKSRYIRKFYLIKLDSPKCPIVINESTKEPARNGKFNYYTIKEVRFS